MTVDICALGANPPRTEEKSVIDLSRKAVALFLQEPDICAVSLADQRQWPGLSIPGIDILGNHKSTVSGRLAMLWW